MKCVIAHLSLLPFAAPALAGTAASAGARRHEDRSTTVAGLASEVHTPHSATAVFFDRGGDYPSKALASVSFTGDRAAVGVVSDFVGRTEERSGAIKLCRSKSEVIVTAASQIKVVSK